LANNINISIPGFDTEYAVIYLDAHQVAASTKSACAGSGSGESQVVKEISGDAKKASSTIRFSLGPKTKVSDMKKVALVLRRFCAKMAPLTK
jgi:cysteine sulfinate desulfinase/cysteine desulfurase-like protein